MKRMSVPVLHSWIFFPLCFLLTILGGLVWNQSNLPREYTAFVQLPALLLAHGVAYWAAKRFGVSLAEETVELVPRTTTEIRVQKPFLLKGINAKINSRGVQGDRFISWQKIAACRIIKGKNDFGRGISRLELLGKKNEKLLVIPFQITPADDTEKFINIIKEALSDTSTHITSFP